jgi:hypothetical protein
MTRTGADWQGIKQAYIHGDWSLRRIGDFHGASEHQIRAEAKRNKWVRLVGTKPLRRTAKATDAKPNELRRRNMVRRLLDALDKRLLQLEARMAPDAKAGGETQSAADAERDARTLSGLARLYAKLVELDTSAQAEGERAGARPSFAVGTGAPAGFYLEFGTARMRAMPWLVPILHARLPGINRVVRKVITAALKAQAKA